MEILKPGSIKLDFLESIFRNKSKVTMDLSLKGKIEKSAKIVEASTKGSLPVYGVNTGFGKLANKIINGTKKQTRGKSIDQLTNIRDNFLIDLLKLKKKYKIR